MNRGGSLKSKQGKHRAVAIPIEQLLEGNNARGLASGRCGAQQLPDNQGREDEFDRAQAAASEPVAESRPGARTDDTAFTGDAPAL